MLKGSNVGSDFLKLADKSKVVSVIKSIIETTDGFKISSVEDILKNETPTTEKVMGTVVSYLKKHSDESRDKQAKVLLDVLNGLRWEPFEQVII